MRNIFNTNKYRTMLLALIAAGNLFYAHADISISGFLQNLTTRIEEIATAPVLQSNDVYVIEEYLNVMLIQNPEIREIARFKPDGTSLKIVAGNDNTAQDQNVGTESWFNTVCLTREPYSGLIRDRQGNPLLFRAWPILEPGAGKNILGVTSVKIDIRKYIQSVSEDKNGPLEVLYNGTPVFRRNWAGIHTFLEDSFTFSVSDKFVVRYPEPKPEIPAQLPAAPEPAAVAPKQALPEQPMLPAATPNRETAPTANKASEAVLNRNGPKEMPLPPVEPAAGGNGRETVPQTAPTAVTKSKAPDSLPAVKVGLAAATDKVAETSSAATFQSWLSTDSILTSGYVGSSDKQVVLFILLVAGLGFVMVFIITTIMVRRARGKRREDKEREAMFKPDPVPAIIADKDTQMMDKEETRLAEKEETRLIEKIPAVRPGLSSEPLDEASHAERETKELPALREFIDDFLKKIHEVSLESNINQRNRVFEEINDDLNVWARSEIKQLSGRLGLLLQAIRECESKDGNSAELQVLRYEVMRIIKEVEDVQERLPQRNSVLIVS